MKKFIPHKLVIEFEGKNFKEGVFLYRVMENGVVDKKFKSITIKNIKFNKLHLNAILKKVKDHIKNIEQIEEA